MMLNGGITEVEQNGVDMEEEEEESCPFEVGSDALLGRHLLASKDLKQGELLIRERPLVFGPSRDCDLCCLGCFASVDDEDGLGACERCGLPVCAETGERCQDAPPHRDGECAAIMAACGGSAAMARRRTMDLLGDLATMHDAVLMLKCLAIKAAGVPAGDSWDRLMGLASHLEERAADPEVAQRVESASAFLLSELNLGHLVSPAEISHLLGAMDVNSFEVPIPESGGTVLQAVFPRSSLLEHSCVPNVHRAVAVENAEEDGSGLSLSMSVRAAVDVTRAVGDHLATIYTDSLWSTADRRRHLRESKYFDCSCRRCADPTELGTYLSALRCARCHEGWVLPEDPLSHDSSWCCDSCRCPVPSWRVAEVTEEVGNTVRLLDASPEISVDQCQTFLRIHSAALHPNHAHMLDVRHTSLHLSGHSEGCLMGEMSDQQLREKEDAARAIMAVGDRLLPGISRLRGTTSYELFLVYQQRALNWMEGRERSKADVAAACRTAKHFLSQSCSLLRYEPGSSAEGRLRARAEEELQMLQDFMEREHSME